MLKGKRWARMLIGVARTDVGGCVVRRRRPEREWGRRRERPHGFAHDLGLVHGAADLLTRRASCSTRRTPTSISPSTGPGTGDGFELFCNGETDIADASRPIDEEEVAACEEDGIEYIELEVAFDGITVMVNPANRDRVPDSRRPLRDLRAGVGGLRSTGPTPTRSPRRSAATVDSRISRLTIAAPGEESGTYGAFIDLAASRTSRSSTGSRRTSRRRCGPTTHLGRRQRDHRGDGGEPEGGSGSWASRSPRTPGDTIKEFEVDGGEGCVAPTAETDRRRQLPAVPVALHLPQHRPSRGERGAPALRRLLPDRRGARVRSRRRSTSGSRRTGSRRPGTRGRRRWRAADHVAVRGRSAAERRSSPPGSHGRKAVRAAEGDRAWHDDPERHARRAPGTLPGAGEERIIDGVFFGHRLLVRRSASRSCSRSPGARSTSCRRSISTSLWSRRLAPAPGPFDVMTLFVGIGDRVGDRDGGRRTARAGRGDLPLRVRESARSRRMLKPILETLAGIPSVVMAFFALTVHQPRRSCSALFGSDERRSHDGRRDRRSGSSYVPWWRRSPRTRCIAVPNALREAAYGLGARRRTSRLRVVFPAAISGIAAAFILGISRAIGETMVVAIAAGGDRRRRVTLNPLEPGQTMTAAITSLATGSDQVTRGRRRRIRSLFFVGLLLFFFTLALNMSASDSCAA